MSDHDRVRLFASGLVGSSLRCLAGGRRPGPDLVAAVEAACDPSPDELSLVAHYGGRPAPDMPRTETLSHLATALGQLLGNGGDREAVARAVAEGCGLSPAESAHFRERLSAARAGDAVQFMAALRAVAPPKWLTARGGGGRDQ